METAVDIFLRIVKEAGLVISFSQPQIRYLQDGGVIIEKPTLVVDFAPKEEPKKPTVESSPVKENKKVN